MKNDFRMLKVADSDDVLIFYKEKEIAIIGLETLKLLQEDDVIEVSSNRCID